MNSVGIDVMTQNAVIDLNVQNYKEALHVISSHIAKDMGLDRDDVYKKVLENDRISTRGAGTSEIDTSGIGEGVAVPHILVDNAAKPYVLIARLRRAIDFSAQDGKPVDVIVTVVSPAQEQPHLHLQRLGRIIRRARDENVMKNVRNADCEDAVRIIFFDDDGVSESAGVARMTLAA